MAMAARNTMSRTDSMQKLQLLSSQQEVLRRRLSLRVPSPSPFTASSPEYSSISPELSSSRSSPWSPDSDYTSSRPIPTEPGMAHRHSIDMSQVDDSHKLFEINQQIKATLTELLNTESVRSDEKYRAWIQERLMDAERQIRKERRRHSSVDREIAESIAEHISPSFSPPRMHWR